MLEHLLFTEKYRPHTVQDCILPDSIKLPFLEYAKQNKIPNLLLSGGPGVGKTTIAKALCDETDSDFMVINGSSERGIDTIRNKIVTYAASMSFGGGRKVIILDEADGLTAEAQAAIRATIEEFSDNTSFIFTCNFKAKIIEAIHSRCSVVDFKIQKTDRAKMAGQFMKRIEWILKEENIQYDSSVIAELITKHFPDYRRTLNELQRCSVGGKIDIGILSQIADISLKDLMKFLKAKDFGNMRKWVAQNSDIDMTKIYRRIYDELYTYLDDASIPQAVITLADYQFKAAFCADSELNLVACLTTIMVECNFQ